MILDMMPVSHSVRTEWFIIFDMFNYIFSNTMYFIQISLKFVQNPVHWHTHTHMYVTRSQSLNPFTPPLSWVFPDPLQWRHNGHDGVSNHQSHDCLLNHLFGCILSLSKSFPFIQRSNAGMFYTFKLGHQTICKDFARTVLAMQSGWWV